MNVRLLYFAAMRDLAGRGEEERALPSSVVTVKDLVDELARTLPGFAERRASVRVAKNEEFANDDDRLKDGDVIALIPPVAGG